MTALLPWQKSSYSQDNGDCVELAAHGGAVLLRESDNPGVVLTTTRKELARFLRFLKAAPTAPAVPTDRAAPAGRGRRRTTPRSTS
ncbi:MULTISPECIES: DUF397 domain-containing protein [Streptomycetaceae]|uniref:DUF397 domain-containing protein n=1 Tax=Streptomycetaceae TaxID=2062 RepID=UPI003007FBC9